MKVSARDKRIKALNQIPQSTPDEDLKIKGLRPLDAAAIRACIAELRAAANVTVAATAHPEWRVHQHAPKRASDPWSIDVSGNWRLLFEYDKKTFEITGLRLADPH
jgi:plasmid maintenance system killer protein